MNDITSGFNTAENVSLAPELAALCGFLEKEIRDLLAPIAEERDLADEEVEEAVRTMRTWYNGYRFSEDETELVYNPTNVLYFLKHLYRRQRPPRDLHDQNLRTDRGQLTFLAKTAADRPLHSPAEAVE